VEEREKICVPGLIRWQWGKGVAPKKKEDMKSNVLTSLLITATSVILVSGLVLAADHAASSVGADAAFAKLKAGNERFATQPVTAGKPTAARRAETARGQHPFAVVVACADSRTAPELVFDQNIGDLFVVRTAGNLVDAYALGSIEYAVDHLGARLIVVLSHERCGAVQAALDSADAPGHVGNLVRDIQPAVLAARGHKGDALQNTIQTNAALVAVKIKNQAQLGKLGPEVRVTTGYYDLDTGRVAWSKE
jgi:carbonic anhydrase